MGRSQNNFSIPVELCSEALSKNLHRELKFAVVLKHLDPDGKFEKKSDNIREACDLMGLRSKRSFYNHLNNLIRLGWANVCDGVIYVRSWKRMSDRIGIHLTKHKAKLYVKRDLKTFDEFLFSAKLCLELRSRKRRVARSKGRVLQALDTAPDLRGWKHCPDKRGFAYKIARQSFGLRDGETFSPENMSLTFIAEMMGITKMRAHRLKKRSHDAGYLNYEKNFRDLAAPALLLERFKKDHPEFACRAHRSPNGSNIRIRLTDSFTSSYVSFVSY